MLRLFIALSLLVSGLASAAHLELYVGPNSFEPSQAKKNCRVEINDAEDLAKVEDAIANPQIKAYHASFHPIMVGPTMVLSATSGKRSVDLVRNTDLVNSTNLNPSARDLTSLLIEKCKN